MVLRNQVLEKISLPNDEKTPSIHIQKYAGIIEITTEIVRTVNPITPVAKIQENAMNSTSLNQTRSHATECQGILVKGLCCVEGSEGVPPQVAAQVAALTLHIGSGDTRKRQK